MTYGDFKDLAKRTASDNILRDKAFNIVKNPKYDGYQRGRTSMAYKFFYKKASYSGIKSMLNQQIAVDLHKPIIKNLKEEKYIHHLKTIFGMTI